MYAGQLKDNIWISQAGGEVRDGLFRGNARRLSKENMFGVNCVEKRSGMTNLFETSHESNQPSKSLKN